MRRPTRKHKCLHCQAFFVPDYRNARRQRYCSKPSCQQASKAQSHRRWLQKPENHHYLRGPDKVKRVPLWRRDHPGYWRRKAPEASEAPDALQETLTPQEAITQRVNETLDAPQHEALQDSFFIQPAVLVGLIAQLTGFALQEDIALMGRRRQQLGRDILDRSPQFTGGHADGQRPDFARQAASRTPAIPLGGSALGP